MKNPGSLEMEKMGTQFEKHIKKVNNILRNIGMSINIEDSKRSLLSRLKYYWKCSLNLFIFYLAIMGQIVWMVLSLLTGRNMLQITYMIPCLTLCLLGIIRLGSVIYYMESINDLGIRLKTLDAINKPNEEFTENIYRTWVNFLTNVINMLVYQTYSGAAAFLAIPFIIMGSSYYTSGEITLMLPFMTWYPFDELDIHLWPFVYVQQSQAAWMTINSVVGPDCFFFTCCTHIHLQLIILQRNLEQIVNDIRNPEVIYRSEEFVDLVNRHRELIRCAELLDGIYSKGTLFNVVTSSLIICAAGFNLKVFDDFLYAGPFISFLFFGMVQVFLHCYYGDCVMRSSMQVGDAIYNSRWYNAGISVRKCLFIVLLSRSFNSEDPVHTSLLSLFGCLSRPCIVFISVWSSKPCKFTAYGFTDVDLTTFNRILSTSWSYFALLNRIYHD